MFGIGLRSSHYPFLEQRPKTKLDWFEAISENYMDSQGRPRTMLEVVRGDYPIALHGVGLSIASAMPLNKGYLKNLSNLINFIEPFIVSDHLCWTGTAGHQLHDLLPFPLNEETFSLVSEKIMCVQDFLKREILIENVSSYIQFKNSSMYEWEFLNELNQKTGCKFLLDINNIYVNSKNHGFEAYNYLRSIPVEGIGQIHLAGHSDIGSFLYDTHSKPVCQDVWNLYEQLVPTLPYSVPTLIEWDSEIPEFTRVEEEALIAKKIWNRHHERPLPAGITREICGGSSQGITSSATS